MKNLRTIIITFIAALALGFSATYYFNQQELKRQEALPIKQVALTEKKASPDFLLLHPGDYVQFNSRDGKDHVIAQGSGGPVDHGSAHVGKNVDSPVIHPDEGYRIKFDKVGTYTFHDKALPDQEITVLVYKDSEKK